MKRPPIARSASVSRTLPSRCSLRPVWFAAIVALWAAIAAPCLAEAPWNLRLSTNNDIFVGNEIRDDFYTFGGRIDLSIGQWTFRWEENAFTDREAGFRFDESYVTIGRLVPGTRLGGWYLWLEAGAAWVGEGLLGEEAQNAVHRVLGTEEVELPYFEVDETYLHGQLELGRQWRLGTAASWGPILSGSWTTDFRTNALVGWRTIWRPSKHFGLDMIVGGRYADTELPMLETRLEREGAAAIVELELPWHFVVDWSWNRYGTERQHLSFGLSFGSGRSLRRAAPWAGESNAVP